MSLPNSTERQEMMKLNVKQLKTKCKTLGLSTTGNKVEIVSRIITKTHNILSSHIISIQYTPPPYYEDDSESDKLSDTLHSSGYEIIHEIDSNYQSIIYVGNTIKTSEKLEYGKKITVKKFKHIFNSKSYTKRILKEFRILHSLKHNNILKLYDIIQPIKPNSFRHLTVILEFVASDLETIFRTNQFFTPLHIQYMLYQILLGVKYMHSKYIAHFHLTSNVILINENCSIKISDFQNAYSFYNVHKAKYNNVITLYTAPEVILLELSDNNKNYLDNITAVDVWSIGCIFGEFLQMLNENVSDVRKRKPLFYGNKTYNDESNAIVSNNIEELKIIFNIIGISNDENVQKYMSDISISKQSQLRAVFKGSDEDALDLIENLLIFDVNKRFNIDKALKHKYFDEVRDKKLEIMENKWIDNLSLDFEKKDMRELILDEVKKYKYYKYNNGNVVMNGKCKIDKSNVILDGYIRQYIIPLINNKLMKIPESVIKILYMYIAL